MLVVFVMVMIVRMAVAHLVFVLGLRLMLVRVSVLMSRLRSMSMVIGFGQFCAFEDVNFGCGDSAAVNAFDLEACAQIEGCGGFVKDFWIDSNIDKRSEKHVTTDSSEAVKVGDAH